MFSTKNLFRSSLIVILFACSLFAQSKYEEGRVYRHVLDNGLTVLTVERHLAPLIYHQVTYKVGARNETLGITGLSHIVEHMMFKGTERYDKGKVSKTISKNSGIFNAFTMNDMTSYYEYIPKNNIEIAMDIESDRMQNSIFNPEEFDSEIEVIKQERRLRTESNANGVFREAMNSVAFQAHPNRDPVIGWMIDIDNVTREEAYSYYQKYYTPNNAFLVLAGDFDTDEILVKVKKYYGVIPKGPEVKPLNIIETEQNIRKTFTLWHNDINSSSFQMAFHIPSYMHADAAALKLAAMIFCAKSRDARLYKRLVDTEKLVSSVAGGFPRTKDPTLFKINLNVKPDSCLNKVEEVIWQEIEKMQTELVTDREFQKVLNKYNFEKVTNYTKNGEIGSRISSYEAYFGWDFFDKFHQNILAVTKEDIKRVMNTYFQPEKVTIGYKKPKVKDGDKVSVATDMSEDFDEFGNEEQLAFYYPIPEDAKRINFALQTGSEDEIIKPQEIAPLIKEFTLDNGVILYTLENHLVPALQVIGLFKTGLIRETLKEGKAGSIGFLPPVMNRSTKNRSYEELVSEKAFVPYSFSVGGSYRSLYFQGYSILKDVDAMMTTGVDIVRNPAFLEKDIEKIRPKIVRNAKKRLKKTTMKAFYYMYNKLFKDHPVSQFNGSVASTKSVTRDDIIALYEKYVRPDNLSIMMIGDMTPEEMKELANQYYGNWKTEKAPFKFEVMPGVEPLTDREIRVFNDKDYKQATINIGFSPFDDVDPNDEEVIRVLNYVLASSALTSRMGIELRDKQGLIYGIKSELFNRIDNIGYWKFNTKTSPENAEKVITGIFGEIKKLLDGGITDAELNTAKNRFIGLLPFYVETPDDVAQYVFSMIRNEVPFEFFDKKGERIMNVTKEDVLRVAQKYFTLDKFIIVVDGPIEEGSLDHVLDKL